MGVRAYPYARNYVIRFIFRKLVFQSCAVIFLQANGTRAVVIVGMFSYFAVFKRVRAFCATFARFMIYCHTCTCRRSLQIFIFYHFLVKNVLMYVSATLLDFIVISVISALLGVFAIVSTTLLGVRTVACTCVQFFIVATRQTQCKRANACKRKQAYKKFFRFVHF